ncbi:hypothetical protein [Streptomyces sp. NPDC047706]|uniref:hypothetical protein n=1 Tax=Streptomyces sp. NPDC047706 TaxID=3365486 RepID=UPI003724A901
MDLVGQEERLSDWQAESKAYAKEFGKQFIAYDMWEEDPARAHAVVTFNLLTLGAGPAAGIAKLSKGGTLGKTAGTLAKIGDALDPISGGLKAADALSTLPKVSQVLANVGDHLRFPRTRFPDGALDLSDRYRVDKSGNLIPLNQDGTPNTTPAPHEPAAADRAIGTRPDDRELVGAGARTAESTARTGDDMSPQARHDADGASSQGAASAQGGPGHTSEPGGGHAADQPGADHDGGHDARTGTSPAAPTHEHGSHEPPSDSSPDLYPTDPAHGDAPSHDEQVPVKSRPAPDTSSDGPPGIDPAKYSRDVDDLAQAHTGRMQPEQEAGVVEELTRAKLPEPDQQKVLRALRKDPYGAGVAEMISRGHLRDVEGYKKLLEMCKQGPTKADPKGMVPAAYMAMRLVSDLQEHGVTRVGVELDTHTFDLDVYTRHADGSVDYGYQLKDVTSIQGIKSASAKAAKQLKYPGMTHRVAVLDVHQSMRDLTPRMFDEAEYRARDAGATFLLRFTDGSITVPPNGPTFP